MTNEDTPLLVLTENGSAYLPVVCVHSLESRGSIPLELIEVSRSGSTSVRMTSSGWRTSVGGSSVD